VELTREIARRFNHIFGKDAEFEEKAEQAVTQLGKQTARSFRAARQSWLQNGDETARQGARELLEAGRNLGAEEKERLLGYLEGGGRTILTEPEALLTRDSKLSGLDGQKMSKSYNNTINMRDDPDRVAGAIRTMPTDPARKRRNDPGDPDKCPVWDLHQIYTEDTVREQLAAGCRSAGIGCLDCKRPLIDAVMEEQVALYERARPYEEDPGQVRAIIDEGCARAEAVAAETLREVRDVVGTVYS
jgi:tryptophanyl-tRNA synthetase